MPHTTPSPDDFDQAKAAFFEGLAHLQAGRPEEAEASFVRSLSHVPGRVSTLINLTATRLALGRAQDSLDTADQVLAIEPVNAEALMHRAFAMQALGHRAETLAAFDAAFAAPTLTVDRDTLASAHVCRGDILREIGRLEEARAAYKQALAHGANAQLMSYCLAGLGDEARPATAPRAYVEALFDGYAGDFDQHLVQVLRYRVPEGLAEPLAQLHPEPFASALDLGCGTGLVGALVRPRVKRLVGLDVSQKILAQAAARGLYDQLLHEDIVQHLGTTTEQHDLVVAADVFIYVGDLEPVFAALQKVMPAGGLFCFSVETEGASEAAGFALLPSLRYAHHETYLRRLAEHYGFEPLRLVHEPVREEQRQPIDGLLVHLRRKP